MQEFDNALSRSTVGTPDREREPYNEEQHDEANYVNREVGSLFQAIPADSSVKHEPNLESSVRHIEQEKIESIREHPQTKHELNTYNASANEIENEVGQDPAQRIYAAVKSEYSRILADKSNGIESHSNMAIKAVRAIAEKPEFAQLQNDNLRRKVIDWFNAGTEIDEIFAQVSELRRKSTHEDFVKNKTDSDNNQLKF